MFYSDIFFLAFGLTIFMFGTRRGLLRSFIQLVGLIITVFLIIKIGPLLEHGLIFRFHFPVIFAKIISFVILMSTIIVFTAIVILIINKFVITKKISLLNRLAGGLLGIISMFFILFLIIYLSNIFVDTDTNSFFTESLIIDKFKILLTNLESTESLL